MLDPQWTDHAAKRVLERRLPAATIHKAAADALAAGFGAKTRTRIYVGELTVVLDAGWIVTVFKKRKTKWRRNQRGRGRRRAQRGNHETAD
jgi:hypothetical protein